MRIAGKSPRDLPARLARDMGAFAVERVAGMVGERGSWAIHMGPGLEVRNRLRRLNPGGWSDVELDDGWGEVVLAAAKVQGGFTTERAESAEKGTQ